MALTKAQREAKIRQQNEPKETQRIVVGDTVYSKGEGETEQQFIDRTQGVQSGGSSKQRAQELNEQRQLFKEGKITQEEYNQSLGKFREEAKDKPIISGATPPPKTPKTIAETPKESSAKIKEFPAVETTPAGYTAGATQEQRMEEVQQKRETQEAETEGKDAYLSELGEDFETVSPFIDQIEQETGGMFNYSGQALSQIKDIVAIDNPAERQSALRSVLETNTLVPQTTSAGSVSIPTSQTPVSETQITGITPTEEVAKTESQKIAETKDNYLNNIYGSINLDAVDFSVLADPNSTSADILNEQIKLQTNTYGIQTQNINQQLAIAQSSLKTQSEFIKSTTENHLNMLNEFAYQNQNILDDYMEQALSRADTRIEEIRREKASNITELEQRRSTYEGIIKAQLMFSGLPAGSMYGINKMLSGMSKYDRFISQTAQEYDDKVQAIHEQQEDIIFNYKNEVLSLNQTLQGNMFEAISEANEKILKINQDQSLLISEAANKRDEALINLQSNLADFTSKFRESEIAERNAKIKELQDAEKQRFDALGLVWALDGQGNVVPATDSQGKPLVSWAKQKDLLGLNQDAAQLEIDKFKNAFGLWESEARQNTNNLYNNGLITLEDKNARIAEIDRIARQNNEDWGFASYSGGGTLVGGVSVENPFGITNGRVINNENGTFSFDAPQEGRDQCGAYVNDVLDLQATGQKVGDTLLSKLEACAKNEDGTYNKNPIAGGFFVMDSGTTGHIGLVNSVTDEGIYISDSNWGGGGAQSARSNYFIKKGSTEWNSIVGFGARGVTSTSQIQIKEELSLSQKLIQGGIDLISRYLNTGEELPLDVSAQVFGVDKTQEPQKMDFSYQVEMYQNLDKEGRASMLRDARINGVYDQFNQALEDYKTQDVNDWAVSILEGRANISNAPEGLRSDIISKQRELINSGFKPSNPVLTPEQMDIATNLMSKLQGSAPYKNMLDIQTGFDTVRTLFSDENIEDATGFDDVTAINAFQRMIDPGATVREGDVDLLKTTIPFLKRIDPNFAWEKFKKGDVLPTDVRKSMLRVAKDIYNEKANTFNESTGSVYKKLSSEAGIDYGFIGTDFEEYQDKRVKVQSPNGEIYEINQSGVQNAIDNGWNILE